MYAITVDILAPRASRNDYDKRYTHSFLALSPRGYVVIVKDMPHPISERKSPLWWCAQVVRGPVSWPRHADFFVHQHTSGT